LRLEPVIDAIQSHQRRVANGFQNIVAAHVSFVPGFHGSATASGKRQRHVILSLACG
jgi:hypothetical protein